MSSSHYVSLCLQFFSSGENEMLSKVRHKSFPSRIKIFDDHAIPISQSRWCRRSPRTMRSLKRLLKARSAPRMTRFRLWGAQVAAFRSWNTNLLSSSFGERELTAARGKGNDHEGEQIQPRFLGGKDTKVHFVKKSPEDKNGSGWRPRARSNAQPWKLGKPPRLSWISSYGGRRRRCRPFLSSSRDIYRPLFIFLCLRCQQWPNSCQRLSKRLLPWRRRRSNVKWHRHHFHHDDATQFNHQSTLLTYSAEWWRRRNLQNIKFSMYINNVCSCLNTLFQHAHFDLLRS